MIVLPDVNVLVALAWPQHTHHAMVLEWFDRRADEGWATCSMTEAGFIRISSNPKVVTAHVPPPTAAALLRELRGVGHHEFWIDDVEPSAIGVVPEVRLVGHRQVTDAHLLAVSHRHGGALGTLDRGIVTLARGLDGMVVEPVS